MSLTRGSLASVVDCHHLWKRLQKDGNAVESSWFVVDCVLERPIVFPECSIHVIFWNLVCVWCRYSESWMDRSVASISVRTEMLLCILDGLECMFACKFRSDCFVCRFVTVAISQ